MFVPVEVLDNILLHLPVKYSVAFSREFIKRKLLSKTKCAMVFNKHHIRWLNYYKVKGPWLANAYVTFCAKGELREVKWAEEQGSELNQEEALYQAVLHNQKAIVHHLCAKGVANGEAVACAVGVGDVELVSALHAYSQHDKELARSMILAKAYGYASISRALYAKDRALALSLEVWDENLVQFMFENYNLAI